jgi:hypothetical protein
MGNINNTSPFYVNFNGSFKLPYAQDGIIPLENSIAIKGIVGHLGNGQVKKDTIQELKSNGGYKVKLSVIDSTLYRRLKAIYNYCLTGNTIAIEYGSNKIKAQLENLPEGFREGAEGLEFMFIEVN